MKAIAFRSRLSVLLALLVAFLNGCANSTSGTNATAVSSGSGSTAGAAPPSAVVLKIGVIAPLDAGQTSFGKGILDSVELAVAQANANNIVPGFRLAVDARDDSSTPSVGAAAATSLVADATLIGVVGTYNSGVAAVVAPILKAANVVEISPGNTDPTLTLGPDPTHPARPNFNYFRMVVPDSIQGAVLARYAFQTLGVNRVSVVTLSKSVSQGLADDFSAEFTSLGGTILITEVVPDGTTDFSSILPQVAQTNPQLLFFGGEYNTGGIDLRLQSRAAGINVAMMGGDGLKDDGYIVGAGAAAEGDYASSVGAPLASLPEGGAFLSAYQSQGFADPPSDFGPYAYDAANVIIAALQQSLLLHQAIDSTLRRQIISAVQATRTSGVTGPIGFDAFGDTINKVLTVYQVRNGTFVPVETVTAQ